MAPVMQQQYPSVKRPTGKAAPGSPINAPRSPRCLSPGPGTPVGTGFRTPLMGTPVLPMPPPHLAMPMQPVGAPVGPRAISSAIVLGTKGDAVLLEPEGPGSLT